ncbi:unnamed protein product [Prunus armeniaca]|uniref:Hexosyltransferase n=1 Tax=Prunus armeniaca TaxID=36596 RepID=A0A6J5UWN2_PRUAR|nr:unnamed protein product [Prunus armeniaca]
MTAFSSRNEGSQSGKRGSQGGNPKTQTSEKLGQRKGIIMRFGIGPPGFIFCPQSNSRWRWIVPLMRKNDKHKDFLRLNHIEGYHELSSKTQIYFAAAVAKWDADFYIKVDDDVHINLGMVGSTLARLDQNLNVSGKLKQKTLVLHHLTGAAGHMQISGENGGGAPAMWGG